MIDFSFNLSRSSGFDLDMSDKIADAELIALFGKSGSGKTTLLRLIAGLENKAKGHLLVDGELWFDSERKICLPVQQRKIGFMFQDYALFPSMSVRKNIAYASPNKADKWIDELLELTELTDLANARPHELSGGQAQRVALARALARRPRLLLLDEPLSALHPELRTSLQNKLHELHEYFSLTTLLVSHDVSEVFCLASRVLLCENGHIIERGNSHEVFVGNTKKPSQLSLSARLLAKRKTDVVWVFTLLIGQEVVEVLADDEDATSISVGERLQVFPQTFSPILGIARKP